MHLGSIALVVAPSIALGATLVPASQSAPPPAPLARPEATFANDAAFLAEHADVVLLQAPGAGPIAVSPALSGRVMTSAFRPDAPGFGLVYREAIRGPRVARGFRNYGGEDRLWLAPEGGPCGLFFEPGARQELATWFVPPAMDGGPRSIVAQDATSITFRDRIALANAQGAAFALEIERRIDALSRAAIAELLGRELPAGVEVVGFRSTNALRELSARPLADHALIAPWVLGQFKPSPRTEVLFPFRGDASALKSDYFGAVPADRLTVQLQPDGGVARFKADAQLRAKIGLSARGATGWIGAFDPVRHVLTLVRHTVAPLEARVPDCDWVDPNPRLAAGDVATSYNHFQEPRFFELESIGAALPAGPGGSVVHVHTTLHLAGDALLLAQLAKERLRAEL
ncbi:MAG: hypothetical protein JNL90_03475 [Planctomycetes bacterium]|nr:hypothetical protein [Planctomycetota bacterium]